VPTAGRDYPGSYAELLPWFPDDDACLDYLDWLRWPDGVRCPRCTGRDGWRLGSGRWECAVCGRQASVTAGTIFHRTRTPLQLWFAVAWQMTSQKHGVSALGVQRSLGLGSYQTAWAMLHRYRAAMVRPGRERLSGHVEVDEAYVGGVEDKVHGRQTETKAIVAIAVEIENPKGFGRIRLGHVTDVSKESLLPFIDDAVTPASTIHTDGWQAYLTLGDRGYEHERTVMSQQSDPAHVVMPGVHRVASLLQCWLLGSPPGGGQHRAPARLPQRVHLPLQPPPLQTLRPALLPAARTGDPRRADHLPQPDRQPQPHRTQASSCDPTRPRHQPGGHAPSLAAIARKH
jgi:transposase-like protein